MIRTAFQRQPSLCDLMLTAHTELHTNPTIASYVMVGDLEVRNPPPDLLTVIQRAVDHCLGMICTLIGIDYQKVQWP